MIEKDKRKPAESKPVDVKEAEPGPAKLEDSSGDGKRKDEALKDLSGPKINKDAERKAIADRLKDK
jgi:hypothetical protein